MQWQLCKRSYLYYSSQCACISRRSQIARQAIYMYALVSLPRVDRYVRSRNPWTVDYSYQRGPVNGRKVRLHVRTRKIMYTCICGRCASIRVLFWQVLSLSTITYLHWMSTWYGLVNGELDSVFYGSRERHLRVHVLVCVFTFTIAAFTFSFALTFARSCSRLRVHVLEHVCVFAFTCALMFSLRSHLCVLYHSCSCHSTWVRAERGLPTLHGRSWIRLC